MITKQHLKKIERMKYERSSQDKYGRFKLIYDNKRPQILW